MNGERRLGSLLSQMDRPSSSLTGGLSIALFIFSDSGTTEIMGPKGYVCKGEAWQGMQRGPQTPCPSQGRNYYEGYVCNLKFKMISIAIMSCVKGNMNP